MKCYIDCQVELWEISPTIQCRSTSKPRATKCVSGCARVCVCVQGVSVSGLSGYISATIDQQRCAPEFSFPVCVSECGCMARLTSMCACVCLCLCVSCSVCVGGGVCEGKKGSEVCIYLCGLCVCGVCLCREVYVV